MKHIKNKQPYNKLSLAVKNSIINAYYEDKKMGFKEISDMLIVSERAVARVLKEAEIKTRRKNRYILNEHYFDSIDTEEKAYILGLLYADGYVGTEEINNIVLALNDKEILDEISICLEFTGNVRKTKRGNYPNSKTGYSLNFSSCLMATALRKIGLYPAKSLTMAELPQIDKNLMRHFIRGYFDGDGTISTSHHTSYQKVKGNIKKYVYPAFTVSLIGTDNFVKNIANWLPMKHCYFRASKTKGMTYLNVTAKRDMQPIFKFLYENATIYLHRKYDKWQKVLKLITPLHSL